MKHIYKLGFVSLLLAPGLALAQTNAFTVLTHIIQQIGQIVSLLIPIVFSLGILAFFYGIMLYVFSKSMGGKVEGKNVMLWSLIAVFVMVSLFGIVRLAQTTLGIDPNSNSPQVPTIGGSNGGGNNQTGAPALFQ